jgi:hypothetical protein
MAVTGGSDRAIERYSDAVDTVAVAVAGWTVAWQWQLDSGMAVTGWTVAWQWQGGQWHGSGRVAVTVVVAGGSGW